MYTKTQNMYKEIITKVSYLTCNIKKSTTTCTNNYDMAIKSTTTYVIFKV